MNQNTAAAIVGALNSVTEALTTVAALSMQQPEATVVGAPRATSGNDSRAIGPRFIDQCDGTVIDSEHRLQWSKATLTPKCISQHDAFKLCEGLTLGGHSDWRLPTRAELLTLVDDTRHAPAIDTEFFPDTKNDWYWTSTVCAWSSVRAWYVYFDSGYCGDDSRGDGYGLVRAVRALLQAPPAARSSTVPEHVRKLVGRIDYYRLRMSYNESYFGEPAGLLKGVISELANAVNAIYPNGDTTLYANTLAAALAGNKENGNG